MSSNVRFGSTDAGAPATAPSVRQRFWGYVRGAARETGAPDVLAAGALLAGNLVLIAPYLLAGFTAQVWNNEYNYISLARLFRRAWSWNPLWYGGLPFHYAYPPLLPALVAAVPAASPARAYHLIVGLAYASTPLAIYWLARKLFQARWPALLAAVAYSICPAPLYLVPGWGATGSGFAYAPYSFVAAIAYTAGPNILALLLALLAVGFAWSGRPVAASLSVAGVLLSNWSSAAGVLIMLLAVAVAKWRERGCWDALRKCFAAAAAGYGLSAFWLTYGALRAGAVDGWILRYGERPPAPWGFRTWLVVLGGVLLLALALWRRIPPLAALLISWIALTGVPVLAYMLEGSHVLPYPWRFGLELNVALLLAAAGLLWLAVRRRAVIFLLVLIVAAGCSYPFLRHAWQMQPRSADLGTLLPFQITRWLQQHAEGARVFVDGELKQTLNAWSDVPQVAGVADQSAANPLLLAAHREVSLGCQGARSGAIAALWLAALNCRYVVVHGAASRETYHWFVSPESFSALPVEWSNGAGDSIHRAPGWQAGDAVVVDLRLLDKLPALRSTDDLAFLEAYVAWAKGLRPAALRWNGSNAAEIRAATREGEALLVKLNYDPGWVASGARTEADPIGFLLLRLPPGDQQIKLGRRLPADVWLGCAVTVLAIVLLLLRWPMLAALVSLVPLVAAFAHPGPSRRAAIAESAFQRLQPALIAPGGIALRPDTGQAQLVSIVGHNFGAPADRLRVWMGGREAQVVSRSRERVEARVPDGARGLADVSVEVNGCRGNAFQVRLP
jgi:hypothetical protein